MPACTDEELLAYLDECLPIQRSAEIEAWLRDSEPLRQRLAALIADLDHGGRTVGEIWRRSRVSCPSRSVWTAYLDDQVGEGRYCAANLDDLQSSDDAAAKSRRHKIFQTSIGRLKASAAD
jgi:hypothetical protein